MLASKEDLDNPHFCWMCEVCLRKTTFAYWLNDILTGTVGFALDYRPCCFCDGRSQRSLRLDMDSWSGGHQDHEFSGLTLRENHAEFHTHRFKQPEVDALQALFGLLKRYEIAGDADDLPLALPLVPSDTPQNGSDVEPSSITTKYSRV